MRNRLTPREMPKLSGIAYAAGGLIDGHPVDICAFEQGRLLVGFGSAITLRLSITGATELARALSEAIAIATCQPPAGLDTQAQHA